MRRKILKWSLLALLAVLVLLIAAIVGPFMRRREISAETREAFSTQSFYSARTGPDRAMLLETNLSAWEERIRIFSQARERIVLSTFDMRPGESTRDLLAVLLHRAYEGVRIQILVDGVSGFIRMEGEPLFYAASSHPNIEIRIYNMLDPLQPWKSQGRMHDKYILVDDLAYILGGRNTFDYFIGTYNTDNRSRDREVLVYNTCSGTEGTGDSSLWQVDSYFQKMWEMEVCRPFHDDPALAQKREVKEEREALERRYEELYRDYPELFAQADYGECTVPTNHISLVSNPTGIYGKEPTVFFALAELMKEAGESVVIHTPYAVCDDFMYDELTQICRSVPEVRLMVNSVENGDNVVASSDYLKHKGELLETGVRLLEYDGGESYHGKSILIDGDISVIGSYNLDLRSTYVDTELMLVVQSEELNEQLARAMAELEQDCRRVLDTERYETPAHIQVAEVPFWKRALWAILGVVLQPFRVLI